MICPNCQTKNVEGARFCMNCGSSLPAACPSCGASLAPGAKFCHNCGRPLSEQVEDPALARLQRYLPGDLAEKLEAARDHHYMEGERRVVTVLFSDVRGSTSLAEKLDPEEWADLMNLAFEYLITPVYRYEGNVARLMGDAILAFFGAPIAHEDDPLRAILAGLDIVAGIQSFRQKIENLYHLDFNIRVGINTGLVVVGEVGSDLRMEYTAMGDAVNLAARMEQAAQPGTVQITENTYKLVAPLVEAQALGELPVKGKSEAVRAYRVLALKSKPGPLRGIQGLATPLVGRQREMDSLKKSIQDLHKGRGQVVCLIGEAGIGKSRLIAELRQAWEQLSPSNEIASGGLPSWIESRVLSFESNRPYAQFQQLIRSLSGVMDNDSPELIREKLNPLIRPSWRVDGPSLDQEDQGLRLRSMLEMLLAVEPDHNDQPLQGEALKRELFEGMRNLIASWASNKPLVMVFDDLHWADPASVDLLLNLFQLTERSAVIFLCVFRAERLSPAWKLKQTAEVDYPHRYLEINLAPLSLQESHLLVENLLSIAVIPERLRDLILDKSEGNPFFVEEVIRELIENGVLVRDEDGKRWFVTREVQDVEIPDNLQALLIARIDRLEEDVRHTLQLASVIGRTFYYRVLQVISDTDAELDRQLSRLQRFDFIREAARLPELEYMFRHALTREAAYNSILLKRRREFHHRVGETLEALFSDRLEEYAPVLAHQFYEAGDERALKYYARAGDDAARLYANTDAILFYSRALEVALSLKDGQTGLSEELRRLYLQRGRVMELDGQFDRAVENYQELETLGEERHDQSLKLAGLMARATLHSTPSPLSDFKYAQKLSEQAMELAQQVGDRAAQARILWILLLSHMHSGQARRAVSYGEQALALARDLDLTELTAYILNDLSQATTGVIDDNTSLRKGYETIQEAQRLWRELGNQPMLVDSLSGSVFFHFLIGNYAQAVQASEEAYRISQKINNLWGMSYSLLFVGQVYFEMGRVQKALDTMEECLRISALSGFKYPLVSTRAELGWSYARLGLTEKGLEQVYQARQAAEEHFPAAKHWVVPSLVRILISRGELDRALAELQEFNQKFAETQMEDLNLSLITVAEFELALARRNYEQVISMSAKLEQVRQLGVKSYIGGLLHLQGGALEALGRVDAARQAYQEGRAIAAEIGSKWDLWPNLVALSRLELRGGDPGRAKELLKEAQEIIRFIASQIENPEWRETFLALPQVKQVLQDI